jgi:hypothetical protein
MIIITKGEKMEKKKRKHAIKTRGNIGKTKQGEKRKGKKKKEKK